ncbi:hypothetical protein PENSPDRAFT_654436 [Peniophora sp. CONT]|nr:hypothetical protein PENSPDRAFT_654436 [Peniophora sp. CONT]
MTTTSSFTGTYSTRDTPAPSVLSTAYRTRRSSLVSPSSSSGPLVYSEHSQTLSVTSATSYTSSPSGGRPSVSSSIPLSVILLSEHLTLSFAMPTATHTASTTASTATTGAPLQALQTSDLGRALGAGLGIGLTAFVLLVIFAVIFLVHRRRNQPPSFKFEPIRQPNESSVSPPPPSPMHAALLEAAVAAQHARDVSSGQEMLVSAPHSSTIPSRTRHTRNGSLASLSTPAGQTLPFVRSRPSASTTPRYMSDPFAADSGSIYAQDDVYSLEDIRTIAVTPPPVAHLPARKFKPGPARKVAFS